MKRNINKVIFKEKENKKPKIFMISKIPKFSNNVKFHLNFCYYQIY